ncbi:aldehyde ferredoxin oxidoreductase N-terminal domain-containing protein [Thermotalea metallivorans]|uniref:Putative oxidoreductase YdhV n=1 Tax=Thermotalea metallivorans TaxID=520762 RepID=A0A140L9G6_9FIRM|nr:aldehyde ferredoxin oxidoreductase N-terminal domain-containing protein [Thermotalea metallivorans]KXG77191.1 putative oxidoreductase YdhV [Thermotalea metallivorans]
MQNRKFIKVLEIDLTAKKTNLEKRKDLVPFLGGVGTGIKLLEEKIKPEFDCFHEAQPIIFSIGPMETIYPAVTKVVALFRSPLTGELGESHAGLRLGMAMRFAGYDAIVISGKAKTPVYLYISNEQVEFKNAEALWGLDTEETGRLLREKEPGTGLRSILRIGPAGEKLISFAGVNVDTYRHFGRLGLGALFGSKGLKGMIVHGDESESIPDKKEYPKVYREIYHKVMETDLMEKYHGIGTSINILSLHHMNSLPTRNLQESSFEFAQEISGESFAEEKLVRKLACSGCPVGCIHIGIHRKRFADPYEYAWSGISYDHELIFALGSFLGIGSKDDILSLIEIIERYGLDCISMGVLLGWITEAYQKGLISKEQLGRSIDFGDTEGYKFIIENVIKGTNEFYKTVSKGTHYAAETYGGKDFAAVLGKHEIAGYHTGYGHLLGMSVGARHSHLDNGGYALDQSLQEPDGEKLVDDLILEEMERNVQNCLVICLFSRKVYDLDTIVKALKAIGIDYSSEKLMDLGRDIFRRKIALKKKLGFDYRKLEFPKRFFETKTLHGLLKEDKAKDLLSIYMERAEKICAESVDLFARTDDEKKSI